MYPRSQAAKIIRQRHPLSSCARSMGRWSVPRTAAVARTYILYTAHATSTKRGAPRASWLIRCTSHQRAAASPMGLLDAAEIVF